MSGADDQRAAEPKRLRIAVLGQAKEIDRLRAELAETRAAGDALADAVEELMSVTHDVGDETQQAAERVIAWRSVRGEEKAR